MTASRGGHGFSICPAENKRLSGKAESWQQPMVSNFCSRPRRSRQHFIYTGARETSVPTAAKGMVHQDHVENGVWTDPHTGSPRSGGKATLMEVQQATARYPDDITRGAHLCSEQLNASCPLRSDGRWRSVVSWTSLYSRACRSLRFPWTSVAWQETHHWRSPGTTSCI